MAVDHVLHSVTWSFRHHFASHELALLNILNISLQNFEGLWTFWKFFFLSMYSFENGSSLTSHYTMPLGDDAYTITIALLSYGKFEWIIIVFSVYLSVLIYWLIIRPIWVCVCAYIWLRLCLYRTVARPFTVWAHSPPPPLRTATIPWGTPPLLT
jgi:hypothetical protein